MLEYVKIYGERCSGTKYLEKLIELNFNAKFTNLYGFKHCFGFNNLDNSENVLFICIVREIYSWINSLYRTPHQVAEHLKTKDSFITEEFWSYNDKNSGKKDGSEIPYHNNIYTKKHYKNIFEMRKIKLQYLLDDLPNKVDNYIFIKYEDLLNDFNKTMIKIHNKGLSLKDKNNFPRNINSYIGTNQLFRINNNNIYEPNDIYNNTKLDINYEIKAGYNINSYN